VRVGANSPSLWPTIESVTNTGTCLRPSCTAIVWPIMVGTIFERRDHVLITLWVPLSFCTSTFLVRWSSTKGPFLRLRGIGSQVLSQRRLPDLRRRTIRASEALRLRVRPSGLPQGDTG